MLKINNLSVNIQKIPILREVSLSIETGSMVGLIGRNGAGKTTLMRTVMGLMPFVSGSAQIEGVDMTKIEPHHRAKLEIGYMPEDRRLIPDLTVEENILVPAWASKIPDYEARLAWVYELMPEVAGFASRKALQLSGGQQKLVALARALLCGRKLLLLDEPFEGVAPALCQRLMDVLHVLKAEGLSVLLSESDYSHSAGLVDKVFIIERGQIVEKSLT
ncbi:ATP-binding cassette domain-containing protein [Geopsychrobacter electrodiphilus]|uniref:ATP-binding cassette domain-containing protein n=1 Tax=Geopsychrobacter electrodiphilus TaxID=225196 RepID=UPI00037419A0|nr:ATP-binding cassette domain-containing protein [Geopsychrobacter electrodiphilus]